MSKNINYTGSPLHSEYFLWKNRIHYREDFLYIQHLIYYQTRLH